MQRQALKLKNESGTIFGKLRMSGFLTANYILYTFQHAAKRDPINLDTGNNGSRHSSAYK